MTDVVPTRRDSDGIDRRTIIKGAAWAVPVMAVAVAAPLAAASVNTSGLAVTGTQTGLLTLNLLDGGGTVTATALTTVPTEFTITNGAGAINQTATVTVTVGRPAGVNISVGRARGFGVASLNGTPSTPGQRTAVYQSAPIVGTFGFPLTTFTTTLPVNVPSNGTQVVPLVLGLAGTSTGVAISALTTFPVTIVVDFGNGLTRTATSSVVVPVGAGLL
ncbi:hypothetical protein [Microbacterium oleivorans]|uniref:Uncharacterized protein n=1 Tax=Microbacterium oleivorans TaxID=273677 RepID=A0A7D5JDT3_9MICO|nr:hypothetical protein [Microbacterium oleivorans]QLD12240.1 hypothetical protein HW566_10925 [Microbacterium oleivorans]